MFRIPTASCEALLPLAVIVLVATGIPLSVAGWGLREGAAGWVFAAVGLGAATGVAASAAYGVASFIAVLLGAVVLAVDLLRRRRPPQSYRGRSTSTPRGEAVSHG